MNLDENPQMATNDLLCVYYETCQTRDCPKRDKRLPNSCPISPEAPKCFCLTQRELNLLCAFVNALPENNEVTLYSPSIPLPIVDEKTVKKFIPTISRCAIDYKTRCGSIVTPSAITINDDVIYLSDLLLQTYVIYSVIDLDYRDTSATIDSEWNGTLIKILAGFLYYDAEYAAKYFRVVASELLKKQNKELIYEVKKVIKAIDEWHQVRNKWESKMEWGELSKEVFPTPVSLQASVQYRFVSANAYRCLQWNLQDSEPVQWAMKFVKVMSSIEVDTSWLLCWNLIHEIM